MFLALFTVLTTLSDPSLNQTCYYLVLRILASYELKIRPPCCILTDNFKANMAWNVDPTLSGKMYQGGLIFAS